MSNPTLSKASTTLKRRNYRLAKLDLNHLNTILQDIGLRLDQVDAIGQNPDFKGRSLKNIGPGLLNNFDTDDLPEGETNLYYTDERVDDRANALLQEGDGIVVAYDDTANTLTVSIMQQPHIADAAEVSSLTLNAGTDSVDRPAFNAALGTLIAEINAIKDKVNNILADRETAELAATS